jgi:hypothetical protein
MKDFDMSWTIDGRRVINNKKWKEMWKKQVEVTIEEVIEHNAIKELIKEVLKEMPESKVFHMTISEDALQRVTNIIILFSWGSLYE